MLSPANHSRVADLALFLVIQTHSSRRDDASDRPSSYAGAGLGRGPSISPRISRNNYLGAALNSIVDGEITDFTRTVQEARAHAIDRMVAEANLRGVDAVVMMRFDSGEISQGITEIVACGTAVMPKRVA